MWLYLAWNDRVLACTFGGEIPHVPGATIKNACLIACRLLSLQLWLFMASLSFGGQIQNNYVGVSGTDHASAYLRDHGYVCRDRWDPFLKMQTRCDTTVSLRSPIFIHFLQVLGRSPSANPGRFAVAAAQLPLLQPWTWYTHSAAIGLCLRLSSLLSCVSPVLSGDLWSLVVSQVGF